MKLIEVGSVRVPDSVVVMGASLHASGSLVVWGPQPGVWIFRDSVWRRLGHPVQPPVGAAFVNGDSVVEVADGRRGLITRISTSGDFRILRRVPLSYNIDAAVYGGGLWRLGGPNAAGNYGVTTVSSSDTVRFDDALWISAPPRAS